MEAAKLKSIVEAILFTRGEPVFIQDIAGVLEKDEAVVREVIKDLKRSLDEDEESGLQLVEIAGGYQLTTKPHLSPYLEKLFNDKQKKNKLSKAALETLAITAYKGPVTRVEIEEIRGVKSGGVISSLLKKDLIRTAGRKEAPGKPVLFGITNKFLKYFGINSIDELPKPGEISKEFSDISGTQ